MSARLEWIENNIPPLYRDASMDDLSPALREHIAKRRPEQGLLLWGPTGSGKTHTIMAMVRESIDADRQPIRKTYREMLMKIKAGFDHNVPEEDIIRNFVRTEFMVIDDLAACKVTEYGADTVLFIIDSRIEMQRPTIITSNLSPEGIQQQFGDRLTSRLQTFLVIKIGGKDKRSKG